MRKIQVIFCIYAQTNKTAMKPQFTLDPKIIAFDADDTLWDNEPYFEEAEQRFIALMSDFWSKQSISQKLFDNQIKNLPLYGYGIKGYVLSMIESANEIAQEYISHDVYNRIINIGKEMLQQPVNLLDGVEETLELLAEKFPIIVATKGDLKDQHRKLHESGVGHFFHHIEVMINKDQMDYQKMIQRLEIDFSDFLMIGNSLKSDILPVIELGGSAVHIPYHTTWEHERISHKIEHPNFYSLQNIRALPKLLNLI